MTDRDADAVFVRVEVGRIAISFDHGTWSRTLERETMRRGTLVSAAMGATP